MKKNKNSLKEKIILTICRVTLALGIVLMIAAVENIILMLIKFIADLVK